MSSFPAQSLTETITPVRLIVGSNNETGRSDMAPEPAKPILAREMRRVKTNPPQHLSKTPDDNRKKMEADLDSPPLDFYASAEPESDFLLVEIEPAEMAAPSASTTSGTAAAITAGAGDAGPEYRTEEGPATEPEPGSETIIRSYAKAAYEHNPVPEYPERARRRGWEGTVLLEVFISRGGKPEKIEVKQSSGFEILDTAAIEAVAAWRFQPARYGTTVLDGWVQVPIVFRLTKRRD